VPTACETCMQLESSLVYRCKKHTGRQNLCPDFHDKGERRRNPDQYDYTAQPCFNVYR
jgi:hypothetical protein